MPQALDAGPTTGRHVRSDWCCRGGVPVDEPQAAGSRPETPEARRRSAYRRSLDDPVKVPSFFERPVRREMNIHKRVVGTALATLMALTAFGTVGVSANSGHGGPLQAIADIQDAQTSYLAGQYLTANKQAVVALRSLRHLSESHVTIPALQQIGCQDEYVAWQGRAITAVAALRAAAFGQGTQWAWATEPRLEKVLALTLYRRTSALYDTATNNLVDCVINAINIPPDWILELAF
jgi:hypothetical protein